MRKSIPILWVGGSPSLRANEHKLAGRKRDSTINFLGLNLTVNAEPCRHDSYKQARTYLTGKQLWNVTKYIYSSTTLKYKFEVPAQHLHLLKYDF